MPVRTIERAEPFTLAVGPHRERAHPALGTGAVHHVEGHHVAVGVAPDHGAVARVLDGVAPDQAD